MFPSFSSIFRVVVLLNGESPSLFQRSSRMKQALLRSCPVQYLVLSTFLWVSGIKMHFHSITLPAKCFRVEIVFSGFSGLQWCHIFPLCYNRFNRAQKTGLFVFFFSNPFLNFTFPWRYLWPVQKAYWSSWLLSGVAKPGAFITGVCILISCDMSCGTWWPNRLTVYLRSLVNWSRYILGASQQREWIHTHS